MWWVLVVSCVHRPPPADPNLERYARELAADDPVHVWDLGAEGPSTDGPLGLAGAPTQPIALTGAFGTSAFAIEAWVRGSGAIAVYTMPDGSVPLSIVVAEDGAVQVTVPSEGTPQGTLSVDGSPGDVPQTGNWHHVAVSWDGATTRIQKLDVAVDGRNVWMADGKNGEVPDGGVMTAGPFPGGLDQIAWYDRYVHDSAFLGHVFVARGARPPRAAWTELPVELMPGFGTNGGVYDLDVSPDGRLVATAGVDGALLWELAPGVPIRRFGDGATHRIAFSADGAWVWAVGDDDVVRAWEAASGREVAAYQPGGRVRAIAPIPDGRGIAVASEQDGQGAVRIWDVPTRTARELAPVAAPVRAIAARPDGARILTCGADGIPREWDLATGTIVQELGEGGDPCTALAYTFGGGVALANHGWTPIVWNLENGTPIGRLEISGPVHDVAIGESGAAAVAGGMVEDGTLHATNLRNGFFTWFDPLDAGVHTDAVAAVDYARDGGIVSGGWDGRIVQWRWNFRDGAVGRELVRRTPAGEARFTADARTAVVGDAAGGVRIWDVNTLAVRARVPLFDAEVGELALSPSGDRAVAAWDRPRGPDEEVGLARVGLIDVPRGRAIASLPIPTDYVFGAVFTPDGRHVVVGDLEHRWVFDAATGASVAEHAGSADGLRTGPTGAELWVPGKDGWTRWDAITGAVLGELPIALGEGEKLRDIAVSPDGTQAAVLAAKGGLWDPRVGRMLLVRVADGTVLREWPGLDTEAVAWSPDGRRLATGDDTAIAVWDVETGERALTLRGHAAVVRTLAFTPDGQHLHSSAYDGTFRRWTLDGAWLAFAADGHDWLVWDDEGHFDASAAGTSLIRAVRGTTSFAVDQVAVEHNRPDLLLERFGLGDAALIEHYRATWARRMRRAGLDPEAPPGAADLPTARILKATGETGRRAADLVIDTRAEAGLAHVQIWIDDVPLFEGRGRAVEGTRARFEEHVVLTGGDDRIEVSSVDVHGRESLRSGLDVIEIGRGSDLTAREDEPGALWFVGFGVSEYADPDVNDLAFAHQDALDLEAVLKGVQGFTGVHTRVLTDDAVTVEAIREAKAFLAGSAPGDTVVVFVAGHGVHDVDAAATYYYLVHDTDPDDLAGTAAPFELVEALLDGIPAREKLFLLDTCESGEADDTTIAAVEAQADGTRARTIRGVKATTARSSVPKRVWLQERDRFVYVDLVRRTGAIVFSSSLGSEYSLESDEWRNGAFTEALIEALSTPVADADRDGVVEMTEVRRYVGLRVRDLTRDAQHPTVDRDNLRQDVAFGLPETSSP